MEISRVGNNTPVRSSDNKTITNKKDFSQSFNFARERKSEQELKEMFEEIKKKGNRLAVTKCYADVAAYKKMIREYLKSVLSYMYSIKKDISFWQTQYFITVETVDQKLEELTQMLLGDQKENLDVASSIDEIAGLLVDIYK
ncbi:YaaR family protein [Clostridium lundense]|uniref:YaaR family protein n=1 Tax=Clostridium lundense TaxID=319475 RepID=UPI0004825833|nr:YaaR family protein [Clostridium lundense]